MKKMKNIEHPRQRALRILERGWDDSVEPFKVQWVLYRNLQPVVNYGTHRVSTCSVLCLQWTPIVP